MATTIEGALFSLLKSAAGITSITTKIGPSSDPASVGFPRIIYSRYSTTRDTTTGGYGNDGPTKLAVAKFQIASLADDLLTTKQLADAIRTAINGYAGTIAGIKIYQIQITDERQQDEPLRSGQEKPSQRIILTTTISYSD